MRRIAALFVPIVSLALTAAACGDSGGGKVAGDVTSGGDTTATGGSDVTITTGTDAAQTTTGNDVAQTTTANDTSTTQDTTPVDQGEGLCQGILACAANDCASATSQAEFDACFQDCAEPADSQAELTSLQAFLTCQNACVAEAGEGEPTPEEEKAIYTCLLEDCPTQATACQAGADFGTESCSDLNSCTRACGTGGSPRCQRDCFEASTADAAETFVKINFCLLSQCADKSGAALNTCVQAAQGVPPCKTLIDECFGDVGAAPGEGGGGGASFHWDMRAAKAWKHAQR